MRFSVDAHAIGRHLTGNEVYVRSLLQALASADGDSELIAYYSVEQAAAEAPGRIQKHLVSGNPFRRLGFDLPRRLRQDRPDLVHVQYTAPISCPVPIVVTVHDVSFLERPEYFTRSRALQLRMTVSRTVARAARVITGSEFSRTAIAQAYRLDPERIAVVPNAAAALFRPLPRESTAAWVWQRYSIPAPFILTVGDLQPRKNQVGLIEAFAEMVRAFPQLPHHLALAGKESWRGSEAARAASKCGLDQRIHFVGFISDEALLHFYNACEFFVFPSLYEGFGLPVLEAMACSRAVACSSGSAVPEVADAAALLFDPRSRPEMVRAMADLARDAELRARMERLGLQRSSRFSWRNTAQKTLEVYYDVARSGRRRTAVHSDPVTHP
jgi:glycosyltransferase involved in cell wall biosynthesis